MLIFCCILDQSIHGAHNVQVRAYSVIRHLVGILSRCRPFLILKIMNEFKGTPGPWKQSHRKVTDGDYRTQVYCLQGKEICTLSWYPTPTVDGVTKTYREDNAKLIASAPELLECLQDFVNSCYTGCSKEELNLLRIKSESIINKALNQ